MLLSRWAVFTALVLLTGVLTVRLGLLTRVALGTAEDAVRRSLAMLGAGSAVVLAAALASTLWTQLAAFRDPFAPLSEDLTLLLSTPWGTAWKAAAAGSLLMVPAFLRARGGRSGEFRPAAWVVATALVVALAFFPSFTGHAASEGPVAQVADGLHVLAAGAWMGTLAVILLVVRTGQGRVARLLRARALLPAFTPVALSGAAVLAVTGAYATWLHLPDITAFWTTTHGRLLLLKLAVVACVAALGAWNWKRAVPELLDDDGGAAPPATALLEAGLGLAVLLITAWLVLTSPASG